MKCPVCPEFSLILKQLEDGPKSHICSSCTGSWISTEHYVLWKDQNTSAPIKLPDETHSYSLEKSGLKFCPGCSYAMVKYKVGHGISFAVDRCGNCGSMWFDGNEWNILKSHNLHDEIHMVFSENWQAAIREKEHSKAIEDMWTERLGKEDYAEMKKVANWLKDHENKDDLLALQFSIVNE